MPARRRPQKWTYLQEIGDTWDVLAAGLAFPLGAVLILGLAGDGGASMELASPDLAWRLPFGAIIVAALLKLLDGDTGRTDRPFGLGLLELCRTSLAVPLIICWAVFLVGRVAELSAVLLVGVWLVLLPAVILPRLVLGLLARHAAAADGL